MFAQPRTNPAAISSFTADPWTVKSSTAHPAPLAGGNHCWLRCGCASMQHDIGHPLREQQQVASSCRQLGPGSTACSREWARHGCPHDGHAGVGRAGDVAVRLEGQREVGQDITHRSLTLLRGGQQRRLDHFLYHAWPDHGVPTSTRPLRQLARLLVRRGRTHPLRACKWNVSTESRNVWGESFRMRWHELGRGFGRRVAGQRGHKRMSEERGWAGWGGGRRARTQE